MVPRHHATSAIKGENKGAQTAAWQRQKLEPGRKERSAEEPSGFAAVGDPEDDQFADYNFTNDIQNKVECFLSLTKMFENFRQYFDFEKVDSKEVYKLYRNMPLTDPDLEAWNASLCCIYMPRGLVWLWDTEHFHPFPLQRGVRNRINQETRVYCNCLVRFFNIDLHGFYR